MSRDIISFVELGLGSVDFSPDVGVELIKTDSLSVETSHCVNDVDQLLLVVAVLELVVKISEVFKIKLALALVVNKVESCPSSFFAEGVSLF